MKAMNPRPPRTIEIEDKLKGLTLDQKIEFLQKNENGIVGTPTVLFGLFDEDFYAAMVALYRTGKRYKNELEFAIHQRNHLLETIKKVENKPFDNHERPYLEIWKANIPYFDNRLEFLKSQIDAGLDTTVYSAFTIHQLNEIVLKSKNPATPKTANIKWHGDNIVLIDIFKQLKNRPLPHSENTYISSSFEDIAIFLKTNFSCFSETKVSTIQRQLESKKRAKRNKIDLDELLED